VKWVLTGWLLLLQTGGVIYRFLNSFVVGVITIFWWILLKEMLRILVTNSPGALKVSVIVAFTTNLIILLTCIWSIYRSFVLRKVY
jgi:hypothetical protein